MLAAEPTPASVERGDGRRILIVDDEQIVVEMLAAGLEAAGFAAAGAHSGEEALAALNERPFDLAVLDVGLPGTSGFDVCRRIRASSDLPIIFLTGSGDLSERLRGFELGADDWVTKPVALSEVVQRVRAVLRRHQRGASTGHVLQGPSDLTLNARTREVHVGAVPVELTAKEFAVLTALLERRGEVLSADAIALAAWGHGTFGERNFVEAQIYRLRCKLASAGANGVVRTIRRTGYVIR